MAELERTYNIPLRKEFLKVPKYRRSKKAITAVKEFLAKHMKDKRVKVGKHLNEHVWGKGIKNPPHHVKVIAKKTDEGIFAELFGAPVEQKKEAKKKAKPAKAEKSEKTEEPKAEKKAKPAKKTAEEPKAEN